MSPICEPVPTMGKASERKRQQKRDKHKRKREQRKQQAAARRREQALPTNERKLVELARAGAFGPAWILEGWDEPAQLHDDVCVVITRHLRGSLLLAQVVWVERSCRGILSAGVLSPAKEDTLQEMISDISDQFGQLSPCEVDVAQSVVLHALDYARSLEFEPAKDFYPAMFEPRPEPLLDTLGARPERPVFVVKEGDPITKVLTHLGEAVGPEGFDVLTPERLVNGAELFDDISDDDEPFEHSWHPADAGGDPTRIDWRQACERSKHNYPLFEPFEAKEGLDEVWVVHDAIEQFAVELRDGQHAVWEARLREEQGLPLTEAQRQSLAHPHADDLVFRPCEPWYQAFDHMLERLGEHPDDNPSGMLWNHRHALLLFDLVLEHAAALSLPPGVTSLDELFDDERVSQVRARAILVPLLAFEEQGNMGRVIRLRAPDQDLRIDEIAAAMKREASHLSRLGWGLDELLALVELDEDERQALVDGLARREG